MESEVAVGASKCNTRRLSIKHFLLVALAIALVVGGLYIACSVCGPSTGFVINVTNSSANELSNLQIVSKNTLHTIYPILPRESRQITLQSFASPGDIVCLYDAEHAREYLLCQYFIGDITGEADIKIDAVEAGKLSGSVRLRTDSYETQFSLSGHAPRRETR